MRLIDVDDLKKRATKVMFRDAPECGEFDAVAVDDIDCIPTIEPARLSAEWSYLGDCEYQCPVCKAVFICGNKFRYCPDCGSRMVNADV